MYNVTATTSGVQHLKFLNIFADDGVPLQQVEATFWGRAFNPIYVDGGIPIGTKIETTIYVGPELNLMYYANYVNGNIN